jgi:hypothetical protein
VNNVEGASSNLAVDVLQYAGKIGTIVSALNEPQTIPDVNLEADV